MKGNNNATVLNHLLNLLKIPVTLQSIEEELRRHPENNSLLGLSDVLDRWQIPNNAYEVDFEQLAEVPVPFIAFISQSEFAVVSHLNDNGVKLTTSRWRNKMISIEEFRRLFSGSVLIAEKSDVSGEVDFLQKRQNERLNNLRSPIFFTAITVLLLLILATKTHFFHNLTTSIITLSLLKITGLLTSILLLMKSIDADNSIIEKLCGGDHKNCNSILLSDAAQINQFLSWSEVGFFYFSGTLFALFFNTGNSSLIQILAILNLISLPYTFYSIYYQWRVAQQWCIFCCIVQAILWIEFFAFFSYLRLPMHMPPANTWLYLLIYLTPPIFLWFYLKPYLKMIVQLNPLREQFYRFKYNTNLFNKILTEEVKHTLPADEHSLIIGNKDAENVITMVVNSYCEPCRIAHKALNWINQSSNVKLQIVFQTQNEKGDPKTEVAAHFMALQNSDDFSLQKAMHNWYEQKQKNYDTWASLYPVEKNDLSYERLTIQKEWCNRVDIIGTPTIFVNGRKLSGIYKPEDLSYLL